MWSKFAVRLLFALIVCSLLALIAVNFEGRQRRAAQRRVQRRVDTLVAAAAAGDYASTLRLLDEGIPADARDSRGQTALRAAAGSTAPNERLLSLLLDRGANVNGVEPLPARTPLMAACIRGNTALTHILIRRGANLNAADRNFMDRAGGVTALMYAVIGGRADTVSALLDAGVDAAAGDMLRRNALMYAIQLHDPVIVRLLLRRHAVVVSVRGGDGGPVTADRSYSSEVGRPYPYPVDINAGDHSNETALMFAVDDNQLDIAHELLTHGAEVNAHQFNGRTALQMAIYRGFTPDVKLLIAHQADVKSPGDFNGTPLHTAERVRRADIIALLRRAGALK